MNGKRYLLDTNAIVALLKGNTTFHTELQNSEWVGISVISQLEFLAFPKLTDADRLLFVEFLERVEKVELFSYNTPLLETILQVRRVHRLKLPDAIVAASAIQNNAVLVTEDADFSGVVGLQVVSMARFVKP